MNTQQIICLMGPTASGKTKLAISLTKKLPCEIISVDSTMVYRGLDIGTAKPTQEELALAPHRLINICDPAESYSAGKFREDALQEIAAIIKRGKIPLLVGGTMLYFHCLQNGIAELPSADPLLRQKINAEADRLGWEVLHQQLKLLDPVAAGQIHPNDAQRIQRALEINYLTGNSRQANQANSAVQTPLPYSTINIIIAPPERELLRQRIAMRFKEMLAQGLLEEVNHLYQRSDLNAELPAIRSVGYRQVWGYLDGLYDSMTMEQRAIIATQQLAKRQFTWLRRWSECEWFDSEHSQLLERVLNYCFKKIQG